MDLHETDSPLGRPHHGDSYEIPPIVRAELRDPAVRRQLEERLRQAAAQREISQCTWRVGEELVKLSRITGAIFPTLATLAQRACCKVRTVQRAISRLRELGLVDWIRRIIRLPDGRGVQTSNTYILHPSSAETSPVEATAAPTAPPQEQNRPREPLRFLRALGNKLETGFMDMVSTGNRTTALEAARKALEAARERPQLRLALQAGRRQRPA